MQGWGVPGPDTPKSPELRRRHKGSALGEGTARSHTAETRTPWLYEMKPRSLTNPNAQHVQGGALGVKPQTLL